MPAQSFQVVRGFAPGETLRGATVAIGNFDGVHRGHRAVIAGALSRARELARPAAALTFEPHPRALAAQEIRRTGAVGAEMKVKPDRGAADREMLDQHAGDEIFRAQFR